ncbi:hypothetical protein NLJ89_g2117 [Agrocybe chaxingu]|uniref:Uncharacterized protein n=1 Tax=Agrocybe chaxingu TaxID=84603 RepID=A0A9W8MWS4_9AGAR|nr:hypothetical protein NLJ89_g2117 [Agrocybe chaxingu]
MVSTLDIKVKDVPHFLAYNVVKERVSVLHVVSLLLQSALESSKEATFYVFLLEQTYQEIHTVDTQRALEFMNEIHTSVMLAWVKFIPRYDFKTSRLHTKGLEFDERKIVARIDPPALCTVLADFAAMGFIPVEEFEACGIYIAEQHSTTEHLGWLKIMAERGPCIDTRFPLVCVSSLRCRRHELGYAKNALEEESLIEFFFGLMKSALTIAPVETAIDPLMGVVTDSRAGLWKQDSYNLEEHAMTLLTAGGMRYLSIRDRRYEPTSLLEPARGTLSKLRPLAMVRIEQ